MICVCACVCVCVWSEHLVQYHLCFLIIPHFSFLRNSLSELQLELSLSQHSFPSSGVTESPWRLRFVRLSHPHLQRGSVNTHGKCLWERRWERERKWKRGESFMYLMETYQILNLLISDIEFIVFKRKRVDSKKQPHPCTVTRCKIYCKFLMRKL